MEIWILTSFFTYTARCLSSFSSVPAGWSEENPSIRAGSLFRPYGENPELGWQFPSLAFDIQHMGKVNLTQDHKYVRPGLGVIGTG